MRRLLVCGAAALLLPLAPARADWGQTRWGMSPAEVAAAVPGAKQVKRVKRDDYDGQHKLVKAPFNDGNFAFDAEFFFDPSSQRLVQVHLTLKDVKKCAAWRDTLRSAPGADSRGFGAPRDTIVSVVLVPWKDPVSGDRKTYLDITGDYGKFFTLCRIQIEKPA
jgi:hypothetical protein